MRGTLFKIKLLRKIPTQGAITVRATSKRRGGHVPFQRKIKRIRSLVCFFLHSDGICDQNGPLRGDGVGVHLSPRSSKYAVYEMMP